MASELSVAKFEHSCFYLAKDGRGILFDPVEYLAKLPELTGIEAVIITHQHGDHFQPAVLEKIRAANPDALVFTTEDNAQGIPGAKAVKPGDKFMVGGFSLEFYGSGNHAEVMPGQVPCQNIGTVIDGIFVNPGDSFDIPETASPQILAAPIVAPWLKLYETIEFIKKVQPQTAIPAHDALNSELGNAVCDNWLQKICKEAGIEYKNVHGGVVGDTYKVKKG